MLGVTIATPRYLSDKVVTENQHLFIDMTSIFAHGILPDIMKTNFMGHIELIIIPDMYSMQQQIFVP